VRLKKVRWLCKETSTCGSVKVDKHILVSLATAITNKTTLSASDNGTQ
jgi:hypothetical protein